MQRLRTSRTSWRSTAWTKLSALSLCPSPVGHRQRHALGTLQGQKKWWLVALTDLIFALTLVYHDLPCQIETDGGAEQRHGSRASDVRAINQKIAAVTGAFEALLSGMPDGCTSQMGTDGNQRIQAISV